jgi:hypothetical protein
VVDLKLPDSITCITGQKTAPFGDAALSFRDTMLASETCEELFTPNAANIPLALNGVEIISNGSGSHHEVSPPSRSHKGSPPACSGGSHWQPVGGKPLNSSGGMALLEGFLGSPSLCAGCCVFPSR